MSKQEKNTQHQSSSKKSVKYELKQDERSVVKEPLLKYEALHIDQSKRYSYADYLSWTDDVRRELIDGFIYIMSAPILIHAFISNEINVLISMFIRKRKGKCKVFHAPIDVRLPQNNETNDTQIYDVVQPDICVICDPSKLDARGCIGAPDLIVEVLSPSTMKKDCNEKFNLYERAGVREYWIVDPKAQAVNIFLLQPNGKYDAGTVYESSQKAPVHIFEGLKIDLNELFVE